MEVVNLQVSDVPTTKAKADKLGKSRKHLTQ